MRYGSLTRDAVINELFAVISAEGDSIGSSLSLYTLSAHGTEMSQRAIVVGNAATVDRYLYVILILALRFIDLEQLGYGARCDNEIAAVEGYGV